MVGWYDPPQLLRTAGQVVTSTIFGRHADYRLIEALYDDPDDLPDDDPAHFIIDYSHHKEFWLDYVADLGEGWNPTYAVAYHSSRPKLDLNWEKNLYVTVRGHVIVFGGDEVYPTASRSAYKERTFHPYECAYNGDKARPDMFAIPGNHDWYDSLVAFTRYFIDKDEIAGFPTPQLRSYFAMKLPQGWWLLALDTQLTSYIDGPQVKYFQLVAKQIADGDSIILCNAEPTWFYEAQYQRYDPNVNDRNLDFVEKEILKGKSVQVFLAGDLHHYRRHEAKDGTQKIIAGGGGAFLHPTHGWNVNDIVETLQPAQADAARTFHHKASWPSASVSRQLSLRNGLFPFVNWKFGIAPASLYLLTAWSVMANVGEISDLSEAASRGLRKITSDTVPHLLGDRALSRIFPFYRYLCEVVPLDCGNDARHFTYCSHIFHRLGRFVSCNNYCWIALSGSRTTSPDRFVNFSRRMDSWFDSAWHLSIDFAQCIRTTYDRGIFLASH